VYFATSIRGAGSDLELAREVISILKDEGHDVVNEEIYLPGSPDETADDSYVFERDMKMLGEADILLADVTHPSLGVGYEICEALRRGKEVIAFYRRGTKVSKLISGNPDLILLEFSDVRELLRGILSALGHTGRVRLG